MDKFEWSGLDEENAAQQKDFIMRKFWGMGTVACRPIENTDLLVFAPYAAATYNLYDYPETVSLINTPITSPFSLLAAFSIAVACAPPKRPPSICALE